jgi:hypothetical protein
VGRSERTEKFWPTETFDEMVARVRAEHGDAIADLILRDAGKPATARKKPVKQRVGAKERHRGALSKRNGIKPQGVRWTDRVDKDDPNFTPGHSSWSRQGLPRSGAAAPPVVTPRVGSQRRRGGLNDS